MRNYFYCQSQSEGLLHDVEQDLLATVKFLVEVAMYIYVSTAKFGMWRRLGLRFYRAVLFIARAMLSQDVHLSVFATVTRRYTVEKAKKSHKTFFSFGYPHHSSLLPTVRKV